MPHYSTAVREGQGESCPPGGNLPILELVHRDLHRRIIEELRRDGRAPLNQLGGALGVSTTTVGHRLKRPLKGGIIRRFKPEPDYELWGYGLTAIIAVKAPGRDREGLVMELERDGSFTHIYEVTGPFDLLLIGKFHDRGEPHEELDRLLRDPVAQGTETAIVPKISWERADLPLHLGGLDSALLSA